MARINLKKARELAGSVSTRNSKMPGSTFALSAKHCITGGKLQGVEGSVCNRCYALKLQKMRPTVDQGWTANTDKANAAIEANPDEWARAMASQIHAAAAKSGELFHRWFDSGDLQSVKMLLAIFTVARRTPTIKHWLPTREAKIVKLALEIEMCPDNLIIRVSSTMVGDAPRTGYAHTSTVHGKGQEAIGHACPARSQGNECGFCRACWDHTVANVSYPLH